MFKIKTTAPGEWSILLDSTGVEVATVSTERYGHKITRTIRLCANGKLVGHAKSKKDALERLEKFFANTKEEITTLNRLRQELESDLPNVMHDSTRSTINNDIRYLTKKIEQLESVQNE